MRRIQRLLAVVLSASILNVSAIHSAQAALVPTEEAARLATINHAESGHARMTAALARDDVRAELLRWPRSYTLQAIDAATPAR